MTDAQGRKIEYMRISITDRCNLRCRYCMPEDLPLVGHESILRYEELLRVAKAAVSLGITSFRVTGGEPLARLGCVDFLRELCALPGATAVSITTNGVLLEPQIEALVSMGLAGLNISLDTLDRDTYRQLTGQDALAAVLRSLEAAVAAGLRVKLNCVPLAGVNEAGLAEVAALAERMPVDVRFIELMPTAAGQPFRSVPGEAVRAQIAARYPDLRPTGERRGLGPARYYKSGKLLGRIGFIDALTGHFCGGCNRVRLTSEGFLKLCIYHDAGVSLREPLRAGIAESELRAVMETAIKGKPARHQFGETNAAGGIQKMSGIGG